MGKFNRQEQLKQLHAERKVKTEQKVSKAINELVRKMKKLTLILLLSIQMYLKLLYIIIVKFERESKSYVNKVKTYLYIK